MDLSSDRSAAYGRIVFYCLLFGYNLRVEYCRGWAKYGHVVSFASPSLGVRFAMCGVLCFSRVFCREQVDRVKELYICMKF